MKINILEEKFKEVPNILAVKTYVKRFDKYETKKDCLTGTISVDLSYYDDSQTENFQTMSFDFDVTLKDGLIVNNVALLELDLCVIDKKGVNVKYNIEIDYDEKFDDALDDNIIDTTVESLALNDKNKDVTEEATFDEKTQEELVIEHMSDEINKEYEKMLGETLKDRNENVNITTIVDNDERGFLDLFNMFESHYLKITKIYVDNKERVLTEYNISEEEFNLNYDENRNVLTLKSYD